MVSTRQITRLAAAQLESASPSVARGHKRKRGVASIEELGEVTTVAETIEIPIVPKPKKKKEKKKPLNEDEGFSPTQEPTYVIPDVERKTTTFRGRLGYACLNTVLRNRKPARESVFCSRTCRLDSLKKNGMDWVKDLGKKNVEDLLTMIQWNEDNHIRFLRLSSEMFPFASHGAHGYSLDYCAPLLARVGILADKYGHRLTTHPGQYTQLGSPRPEIVQSAVRELSYHCEMLDRMGVGVDGVMIVHGGGMYEDKSTTLERIKKTVIEELPENVRSRLVLENDELCYKAEDLLPICEELDVPLVFDYHHDALNPSSISPSAIIERANAIFARRGIRPKQHLSEPRPGAVTLMERRAHADRCENLPPDLPDDMDLMIEAKDKEQAVLHLYRMYNLHPVNHSSLRPPDENQTKETKGRKSNKRAKAKAEKSQANGDDDYESNEVSKPHTPRKSRMKRRASVSQETVDANDELEDDSIPVKPMKRVKVKAEKDPQVNSDIDYKQEAPKPRTARKSREKQRSVVNQAALKAIDEVGKNLAAVANGEQCGGLV